MKSCQNCPFKKGDMRIQQLIMADSKVTPTKSVSTASSSEFPKKKPTVSSNTREGTGTRGDASMVEGQATCNLPKTHLEQDFMPRPGMVYPERPEAEVCYGTFQDPYW